VNTIVVRGSEIINKLVGESEKSLARVFAKARLCAPCIIFIDQVKEERKREREREETERGKLTFFF
jgi:ribosome biogenesis ATPase